MERKKRILKKISSYVLLALFVSAFVFFAVMACLGRKYALFTLIGMATHYVLSVVFHEIGHLAVGKMRNMVFVEGKILFLRFFRKGGEKKIGLCYPFEAGEISMVSADVKEAGKDLAIMSVAGNLFVFAYLIICVLIGVLVRGYLGWYFFALASVSTVYTLIINAIPFTENNDGALFFGLKKGKENYKSALSLAVADAYLYSGVSPADIPDEALYVSRGLYSYRVELLKLLKLIDCSKMERAYVYTGELIKCPDNAVATRAKKERFFLAVIMSLSDEVEKLKEEVLSLLDDDGAENVRINYYYRLYTKEKEWANLIKTSSEKVLKKEFFKGIALMEEKLIKFEK